jgi:hypothetical protein
VIAGNKVKMIDIEMWTADSEGTNRLMRLLNMALRQKLGHDGISYDRDHHRYYFRSTEVGHSRSYDYRSVTDRKTSRKVVWQPKRKRTGETRKFWFHLAAGITFQRVSDQSWILTLRPERHMTKDGEAPYSSRHIGRRVTSLKARMYNAEYLEEVHFWRYVLSAGKPDIHLPFGRQHVLANAEMLKFSVEWPGTDGDTKAFTNIRFEDDLFSLAERQGAETDELDDDCENELDEED